MAEDIIIRYRAETDEFLKELNVLIDKQDQLADEAEKTAKSFDKSATNEVQAAKRRQQAIDAELKNIERLKQARARAFDPALIDRFNRQISEGEKRIKSLTSAVDKAGKETVSTFNAAGSQIKNIGLGIAAGFAAAFSVDAIVNFSKASVNAFIDAEKNANKLKFAITSIGGESEEAFNRLIKQSNELQKITIFSDDAIQQAQAALSAFGLTADQIEALIPKLADFATVTGQDIVSAVQQVGSGLEGAGREFKKYGIEVSATASRQENLNSIMDGFAKFAGAATEATTTLAGQVEVANNQLDDLQETVGSKLAPAFVAVRKAFLEFIDLLLTSADDIRRDSFTKGIEEQTQKALDLAKDRAKSIQEIYNLKPNEAYIKALEKEIELNKESFNTLVPSDKLWNVRKEQIKALEQELERYGKELEKVAAEERRLAEENNAKRLEEARILNEKLKKLYEDYIEKSKSLSENERQTILENAEKTRASLEKLFQNPVEVPLELKEPTQTEVNSTANKISVSLADSLVGRFEDEAQASFDVLNELTDLFNSLTNQKIEDISRSNEAFTESLRQEEEALQESRDKRLISEQEYLKRSEDLKKKEAEAEKKLQKEIAKERQKQALINKIAATFEIAIQTAINVTKALGTPPVPNFALAALAGALGAAQLAAVAAQPIPKFAKGTKGKKGSGMALVGEQGAEMTFLPDGAKVLPAKQTKTYGEVFDAMFDNRFDSYVLKNYVAPALEQQRKKFEGYKQESFTKNIVNSMQYNGITTGDLLYANSKGTKIKNADEIAYAIAKALKTQSPDLWRM